MTYYKRESLETIHDRISQDIEVNKNLNFSFRNVIAVTLSGISHLLHSHIEKIAKNAVPLTADETLEDWAKVFGLFKKGESRASGEVKIRSFLKEKIQNLEFIAENGVSYFASNLSLEAGDNSVQVVCNLTGKIGNLTEAPLSLKTTHENIKTEAKAVNIKGGADKETKEELRRRLLQHIRSTPQGGCQSDYINWIEEVEGVRQAFVRPTLEGPGTVTVSFLTKGDNPIPSKPLTDIVKNKLDALSPATAKINILKPTRKDLSIEFSVEPEDHYERGKITEEIRSKLTDFVNSKQKVHGFYDRNRTLVDARITRSQISSVISNVPGEKSHVLTEPKTDITLKRGEVLFVKF